MIIFVPLPLPSTKGKAYSAHNENVLKSQHASCWKAARRNGKPVEGIVTYYFLMDYFVNSFLKSSQNYSILLQTAWVSPTCY